MEPTTYEKAAAYLRKLANYLTDPRTITLVASIIAILKMTQVIDDTLDDAKIVAVLGAANATLLGLSSLILAIGAVVVLAREWSKGWTDRPSRGIEPFLKVR